MWYYSKNDAQLGPISVEEISNLIRNGTLGVNDLVWKAGMSAWIRIGDSELATELPPNSNRPPQYFTYGQPPVPSKTERIRELQNYITAYIVVYIITSVLSIHLEFMDTDDSAMFSLIILLPLWVVQVFLCYRVVVALWKQIPSHIASLTPQSAGAYTIIPFFCFYGWFPAFVGLANDMNKTASRCHSNQRFALLVDPAFAIFACVFWVCSCLYGIGGSFLLSEEAADGRIVFNIITNVIDTVVTCCFFLYLKNGAVKLIEMEP